MNWRERSDASNENGLLLCRSKRYQIEIRGRKSRYAKGNTACGKLDTISVSINEITDLCINSECKRDR